MSFEDVLNRFSYLFEGGSSEKDYELVCQNMDVMTERKCYAKICLDYLRENIVEMAPITLLTNVGLLMLGKSLGLIEQEYRINQFEIDFLMALVLKYGKMKHCYSRTSNPEEIYLLLKAITIYFTCEEHELHKDDLNAFLINSWYKTGRIEGVDNDKLQLLNEFCEKYDTLVKDEKVALKNVIKLLYMYDETISKRLERILGKTIYLEQQYSFFVFDKDDIKNMCENNDIDYNETIRIMELFSCKVGDFRNLQEIEIYLENPIWNKFIVKITEQHFFIPNINALMENIFQIIKIIVAENKANLDVYAQCRASFLEEKTYSLLLNKFGDYGKIYLNSEWDYKDRHGENDCILVYENYAIIIENKSGEINKNTVKGLMGRARSDSKKLIYDPTEQALLFSELIEENYGKVLNLKVKGGRENIIDLRRVNKNIRIGVIFDDSVLQNIAINGERHIPIVSIFQLNKILKILKREEIVDYFMKRTFIEKNTYYHATEYDFLYTYLINGINTSNKIYERFTKNEKICFHYKDGEITRDDLIRENWFQMVLDRCMENEDENKLEKVINLLEIPPVVQKQIWRDIKKEKRLELIDNLEYRKKMIIVRLLDFFDSDTYREIDEEIEFYEKQIKKEKKIENILYIAITSGLEKIIVKLSIRGKRIS